MGSCHCHTAAAVVFDGLLVNCFLELSLPLLSASSCQLQNISSEYILLMIMHGPPLPADSINCRMMNKDTIIGLIF